MPDDRANRWWNFSLRTLLVVVTQFAIAFAIAPTCLERYHRWQQDHRFDELIQLISTTVTGASGWSEDVDGESPSDDVPQAGDESAL